MPTKENYYWLEELASTNEEAMIVNLTRMICSLPDNPMVQYWSVQLEMIEQMEKSVEKKSEKLALLLTALMA